MFDEGFGACVPEDDVRFEVLLLESLLKYMAYTTEVGDRNLVAADKNGHRVMNLTSLGTRYMECSIELELGSRHTPTTFEGDAFKWHRNAARLYFSSTDIYQNLGFKQFDGQSWRWAWLGARRTWGKAMAVLALDGHVLLSAQVVT